jgi:mRNA interferase RelE/StbE
MGSYNLTFKPSVEKDLEGIPRSTVMRILKRIEGLALDPFPPNSVKLSGSERLYRIRVGDYRVVYEVEARARLVVIHYVRHRRDVYRRI